MEEVIARYLHFAGIILLSSALFSEYSLLKNGATDSALRKLARADAIYGIGAVLVFCAGIWLWLFAAKPADFYTHNGVFHAKLAVFAAMTLLSIYPTLFFIKHRASRLPVASIPKAIMVLVRLELALLFLMPLFAVLMARGYGLQP